MAAGGSPVAGISDVYSATWTAPVTSTGGVTTLYTTADDDVSLWIDGVQVGQQGNATETDTITSRIDVNLGVGSHGIELRYANTAGTSRVALSFDTSLSGVGSASAPVLTASATSPTPTGCGPSEWRVYFYDNRDLTGTPVSTVCDATMDETYTRPSLAPPGVSDYTAFSAVWVRDFTFAAGITTFTSVSDDSMRMWVDGAQVIEKWGLFPGSDLWSAINVDAGTHRIVVDYRNLTIDGLLQLRMTPNPTAPAIPLSCEAGFWTATYYAAGDIGGAQLKQECLATLDYSYLLNAPGLPTAYSAQFTTAVTSTGSPTNSVTLRYATTGSSTLSLDGVEVAHRLPLGSVASTISRSDTDVVMIPGTHIVRATVDNVHPGSSAAFAFVGALSVAPASAAFSPVASPVMPTTAPCIAGAWKTQFWNNFTFAGPAVVSTCTVGNINDNWGTSAPAAGINANFSTQYAQSMTFAEGMVTVDFDADDTFALWIDGQLITSTDGLNPNIFGTTRVYISAGVHNVIVRTSDYSATARVSLTLS
jgi:PA14 domain